jgi:hypothetical protein
VSRRDFQVETARVYLILRAAVDAVPPATDDLSLAAHGRIASLIAIVAEEVIAAQTFRPEWTDEQTLELLCDALHMRRRSLGGGLQ